MAQTLLAFEGAPLTANPSSMTQRGVTSRPMSCMRTNAVWAPPSLVPALSTDSTLRLILVRSKIGMTRSFSMGMVRIRPAVAALRGLRFSVKSWD